MRETKTKAGGDGLRPRPTAKQRRLINATESLIPKWQHSLINSLLFLNCFQLFLIQVQVPSTAHSVASSNLVIVGLLVFGKLLVAVPLMLQLPNHWNNRSKKLRATVFNNEKTHHYEGMCNISKIHVKSCTHNGLIIKHPSTFKLIFPYSPRKRVNTFAGSNNFKVTIKPSTTRE